MARRDNGMLNADFLRRCRKIGYVPPRDILPHWRDGDIQYPNNAGLMLEYWRLSSSEQTRVDERLFREKGYVHEVHIPQEDIGRREREILQAIMDNGHTFQPWTHLYPSEWYGRYLFTDHTDAVFFRLSS